MLRRGARLSRSTAAARASGADAGRDGRQDTATRRQPVEPGMTGCRSAVVRGWTIAGLAANKPAMLRRLYDWCIAAADKPHATWLHGHRLVRGKLVLSRSARRHADPDVARATGQGLVLRDGLHRDLGRRRGARLFHRRLLYDSVGLWLIQLYGYGNKVEAFREAYAQWGAWIILLKGLTPIPYKIVTIASGFAGYNLFLFVLLSIVARGMRFYLAGVPAQPLWRAGAHDHRGAAGVLGHRSCGGAGRRHRRRPVSSSESSVAPHFRHAPCARCGRLRRQRERDDQPSGNNSNARFGDRGARGGRRLRAVPGLFRARAGGSIPKSGSGPESASPAAESERLQASFSALLLPPLPPQPNLVETFGRWLDQGTTKFRTDMQGAQETFDKLGNQNARRRQGCDRRDDRIAQCPRRDGARALRARRRTAAPIARRRSIRSAAARDSRPARASTPSRS